jgi:hypothetical protein
MTHQSAPESVHRTSRILPFSQFCNQLRSQFGKGSLPRHISKFLAILTLSIAILWAMSAFLSTQSIAGTPGTLKWTFSTGGQIGSSPAIGTDGTIYVGGAASDGFIYSLNPDGTLKWKYQTGWWVFSSPAIGSDGTVYVGSIDDNLYALNPDGSLKWKYQTGEPLAEVSFGLILPK